MPELPEVETIKRGLESKIIGKKIVNIIFDNQKSFQGDERDVIGQTVTAIERRAKILRIRLSNDKNILFHLKMTGQLIYIDQAERIAGGHPSHDWHAILPNKHTRIVFAFNDGSVLFFNDLRKFGWAKVLDDDEINTIYTQYGPEPFSVNFTTEYLIERAERLPSRTAKQFIMDQTIIAGVGNIYADESLFLSKIMPRTKVKFLSKGDFKNLRSNILKVLEMGIKYGGTTDSDYVNAEGKKGGMQNHLNVYHRTGESCVRDCGGKVERIIVGGRGTNYCPCCQKEII